MMIAERIQALIHKVEVAPGGRGLNYLVLALAAVAIMVWYDTHCYHGFNSPEAMDAAQVARNLAEHRGFTTKCIRPFSVYLLQKHHPAAPQVSGANLVDYAEVYGLHPDLANAPLYPALLAGLFKVTRPTWTLELHKAFWGGSGRLQRYKPEFMIAILNQLLLLVAVGMTFRLTRAVFDPTAGWLAALLMFGSDRLWRFSVSGLPTLLLLVIFLGLIWCLVSFEAPAAAEDPNDRRRFRLALVAGVLAGLGMLTQYSFGWVIIPVAVYFVVFGGVRGKGLALAALLVFAVTVSPWMLRNLAVSGTFLGAAGYEVAENTMRFPDSQLMQSLNPDLAGIYGSGPYLVKLGHGLRALLENNIPKIGGGWISFLFLAGLLLRLRNVAARRLRYFTMMCLGVFLVVTALGQTPMATAAPEANGENLLVLIIPLAIIFGLAFFLTLLDQMDVPALPVRFMVMGLVVVLACQQFIFTLLPPKTPLVSFPPYLPPDIQRFSQWILPDELMMSDIPWAVAWYGDRQCIWTTVNSTSEFYQLNDDIKHVSALYLSQQMRDGRLLSDYLQTKRDSWYGFVLDSLRAQKSASGDAGGAWDRVVFRSDPDDPRTDFPLHFTPAAPLPSGIFLVDRPR